MTITNDNERKVAAAAPGIRSFADRDPFPFYDELRREGSPVWDQDANAWLVLDFEQCVEIEACEEIFGNAYMKADPILIQLKGGQANVTVSQGANHDRLRKFHLALLSARAVQSYRENHIRPIIDFVLDRFVKNGKVDLVTDFAQQVVPRVICSLMGMPWHDDATMARILELNDAIVRFVGNNYRGDELRDQALAASAELNAMLLPYVRERRERPSDDFISRVWQEAPTEYGDDFTEDDAIAICRELYFAASDTTIHGISNALYLLLTDEQSRKQVQQDRKLITNLIEEALRLYNVVQMRHRIARVDTELGGQKIKQDDMVLLVHAAANRDPEQFVCPHMTKLERPRPAQHMAFGRGGRSCIGAQLARAEMAEMLGAVLDHLPQVQLDPDAESPRFRGFYMRSWKPLNVVWEL